MALDDTEVEYWERVAEDGDVEAMRRVASLLRSSDPSRSLQWLTRAAESGHTAARFSLGVRLAGSDPGAAAHWYRLAADAGSVKAMYHLGLLLKNRDRRESRRWLEQAALRDQDDAMFVLVVLLRWRRPREALRWARLAADKGNVYAINWLSCRAGLRARASFGAHRQRLFDEERELLRQAVALGHPVAMCRLGVLEDARGKHDEARRLYQAAADRGHDTARLLLDGGITGRRMLPLMRSHRRARS